MARRIVTDQASTGQTFPIRMSDLDSDPAGNLLVEAPDFSIPTREDEGSLLITDASGRERQIVPGEILIISPLFVTNKTATARWVQITITTELGDVIEWSSQLLIPGLETIAIPLQGTSLLKQNRDAAGNLVPGGNSEGDRLFIVVEESNTFDCYATAAESEMGTHAPDTEINL